MPTNKTDRVKIHPILEFEQERNTMEKVDCSCKGLKRQRRMR